MNEPPFDSDPGATQPIPVTPIPQAQASPPRTAPAVVPRFGNVPLYLLARLAAFVVDVVAIAFVVAAFGYNAFERGFVTLAGRDEGGFVTLAAVSLGAALFIAFLCESLFGSTLGKAIFGLQVRRSGGGHAGVARVFLRYVLRPIDLLAIGPLLALVTPRHQRLGDFVGGTVVARARYGPLASILGIAVLAALVYAQAAFGGGLAAALGVSVEAANFGPDLLAKSAAIAGIVLPHASVPASLPVPFASPSASPAPAVEASEEPVVESSAAPAAEASEAPAPETSDEPNTESSDAPTSEPSDAPSRVPSIN